ncbi:unnamed protein product, partial [Ectocarpus sp. 8 AP-2014]
RGAVPPCRAEQGSIPMVCIRRSMVIRTTWIVLGVQLLAGLCEGSAFASSAAGTPAHAGGSNNAQGNGGRAGAGAAMSAKTSSLLSSAKSGVRDFFATASSASDGKTRRRYRG